MTNEKICYASERTIAINLGVHRRTVQRELGWLVENGYLTGEYRPNIVTRVYKCTARTLMYFTQT